MSALKAKDMPVGSVVATRNEAWIKRTEEVGPNTYESYWIGAQTFSVPVDNMAIDGVIAEGGVILRFGDGTGRL